MLLGDGAGATPVPIEVPPATECRVPPREIEEIARLGTAATPVSASEDSFWEVPQVAAGYPRAADAATAAEISAVVREYAACINAGAVLRGFALWSDDFVRRAVFPFGQKTLSEGQIAAMSAVNPLPPSELEGFRGIGEVTLVNESTAIVPIVAEKVSVLEAEPEHEPWLFVLVKIGDRWLIDIYGLPEDVMPTP
jgi:hypothetical protein